ncbi:MAG TPA: hypothetical protein VJV79_08140 [Polyangiaceae bacterium]|nr:hypothetical protein [Polyangiaceae bacterium]
MRHRYPFQALHWLREQRVDRRASSLADSVQRAARARSDVLRAEAVRRNTEQALSALSDAEQLRLQEGLVRAHDLKVVADWQEGAAVELGATVERERQAREAHDSQTAAEARARRALAVAKNDAQLVDAHRDGFRAQRARAEELSEEEAAAEQWTASHFSSRRS